MHIHILGVCGTFMGGVALLARALGHRVSGSDANVYPPMSLQLEEAGIELREGYDPAHLCPTPDVVVVGNALSRGNPAVEYLLDAGLRYTSGPQWLAENVLRDRWVLAVAGTHGKTTTASLLAWMLEQAGLMPGFLIGGVPGNFGVSARLGGADFFVVEADEYDTAFFDKRSKFVHYSPKTLIINNIEFDHADIFPDLASIQRQFNHLLRTVPGSGLVVAPAEDNAVREVLRAGCWTPVEFTRLKGEPPAEADWVGRPLSPDCSRFAVVRGGRVIGEASWPLLGWHNMANALSAIAAAHHVGVSPSTALRSLDSFANVKRRLELRGEVKGVAVYDDFAHHPTAIAATLEGLRGKVDGQRIIAVLEPRSNSMRMGVHRQTLAASLGAADLVVLYQPPDLRWDMDRIRAELGPRGRVFSAVAEIVSWLAGEARPGDHILVMSNGGFENIHERLLGALDRGGRTARAGGSF